MKKKFIHMMTWLSAVCAVMMMRISAEAPMLTVAAAPMTGDKGFKKYIIWIVIAAVLLILFILLGILQKKRQKDTDDSQNG